MNTVEETIETLDYLEAMLEGSYDEELAKMVADYADKLEVTGVQE